MIKKTTEKYMAYCPGCKRKITEHKPLNAKHHMNMRCEDCGFNFSVPLEALKPAPEEPARTGYQKLYMNKLERERFLFGHNAHHMAQVILDLPNLPPAARECFEEAKELLMRGAEEWVKHKEPKVVAQLLRESELYTINLTHRKDAKRTAIKTWEADKKMRQEVMEEVGRDPILDIIVEVLNSKCRTCDGTPACSKGGCNLAKALETMEIPGWHAKETCPYAYSGLLDEEIEEWERKAIRDAKK